LKIRIGAIPEAELPQAEAATWHRISGSSQKASYLLAWSAGLGSFFLLYVLLILASIVAPSGSGTSAERYTPWFAILLTLLIFIPVHELLHLLFHPQNGRSSHSILTIWPTKLRFGIYYDGCMSRRQWLIMRIAPFIGLSIIPAIVVALANWITINYALVISLELLILVNCIGSGGDIVAVAIVLRQVPSKMDLCFYGGKAYWRSTLA